MKLEFDPATGKYSLTELTSDDLGNLRYALTTASLKPKSEAYQIELVSMYAMLDKLIYEVL